MGKAQKLKRDSAGRLACALLGAFAFGVANTASATVYNGPQPEPRERARGLAGGAAQVYAMPTTMAGADLTQAAPRTVKVKWAAVDVGVEPMTGEFRPVLYGRFGYPRPGQPGMPPLRTQAAAPNGPAADWRLIDCSAARCGGGGGTGRPEPPPPPPWHALPSHEGHPAGLNYSVLDYLKPVNRLTMMRDPEGASWLGHSIGEYEAMVAKWRH